MSDAIRVLIVDDSVLMKEALKAILEKDESIEVVGMAKDGKEGVSKALSLKPDVITMDLRMPIMSGIEAIENIMEEMPVPIIVISSMDITVIMKALSIGAMDFVPVTGDIETIEAEILEKVKIASRVKAIRRIRVKPILTKAYLSEKAVSADKVVAIGVSTGGPQAIQELLARLPKDFNSGILIVQHISKGFVLGLAEWLNMSSSLHVSVAKAGDILKPGMVLLAPDDLHMRIDRSAKISLSEDTSKTSPHVPSIDVMMKSVAQAYQDRAIGVIMTGMGHDGVEGIREIKKYGGITIAQDEATSIVYGMNKIAVESNIVDYVVPLDRLHEQIKKLV